MDLGGLQDALLGDVPEHHRHPQPPRGRHAARLGVGLDTHHGDVHLPQPGEHARADLAETEQDDVTTEPARRLPQCRGAAEGPEGFEHGRQQHGQQQEPDEAGQQLQDLAAGVLVVRGLVDGEQVEQRHVCRVQRMVAGDHHERHGECDHAARQTGQRPPQPAREQGREGRHAGPHGGQRRTGIRDLLQDDGAASGGGLHRRRVGKQSRPLLAAVLRTVRPRRVVARRGQQREGAQSRVGHLTGARRLPFHRAQQQSVRLDDLAGADERGRRQRGRGGVGVGQHGRRGLDAAEPGYLTAAGRQRGALVQEFLDVLAEAPVVQAQDQAQPGIEPAGGQGGADVGLVVVVHEGQRGGAVHPGLHEHLVGGLGGLQFPSAVAPSALAPLRAVALFVAARPVDRRVDHAVQQRRRAGPSDHRLGHPAAGGRDDEGDLLAVHTPQFGGQSVREPVVAAHHHVRVRVTRPALIRNAPHVREDSTGAARGSGSARSERGRH